MFVQPIVGHWESLEERTVGGGGDSAKKSYARLCAKREWERVQSWSNHRQWQENMGFGKYRAPRLNRVSPFFVVVVLASSQVPFFSVAFKHSFVLFVSFVYFPHTKGSLLTSRALYHLPHTAH
jgi:hypothetical protein